MIGNSKINNIDIFISHSTDDLKEVEELGKELEYYGFQVFIAHRDITPSTDWVKAIERAIKNCKVFIAYLSKNFTESDWCDQETGIAYAKNKKIIPIQGEISVHPYGFIGKIQGMKTLKYQQISNWIKVVSSEIVDLIFGDSNLKEYARSTILSKFFNIQCYSEANRVVSKLQKLEPFTEDEIKKIIIEANRNDQIYRAYYIKDEIRMLITKYEKELAGMHEVNELLKKFGKSPDDLLLI